MTNPLILKMDKLIDEGRIEDATTACREGGHFYAPTQPNSQVVYCQFCGAFAIAPDEGDK